LRNHYTSQLRPSHYHSFSHFMINTHTRGAHNPSSPPSPPPSLPTPFPPLPPSLQSSPFLLTCSTRIPAGSCSAARACAQQKGGASRPRPRSAATSSARNVVVAGSCTCVLASSSCCIACWSRVSSVACHACTAVVSGECRCNIVLHVS
jgi:hypothetical protein